MSFTHYAGASIRMSYFDQLCRTQHPATRYILNDWRLTNGPTELNANRYKYWRWTPRHAMLSFVYMGLIPGVLGYIAYKYEVWENGLL